MPTKEWLEGYRAYHRGVVVGSNPYDEHDERKHWDWMAGWAAAGMEKLKGQMKP